MNDTFYRAFATIPAELRAAGLGGSYTGTRRTGGNTGALTTSAIGTRDLTFIAAQLETFVSTFPEVRAWAAPWLVLADPSTDVQKDDIYTDGTRSYKITASPVTHYGFVLAPATPYYGTVSAGAFFLLETGDYLLLESGDKLELEGVSLPSMLLLETGDALLLETGDQLLLEAA